MYKTFFDFKHKPFQLTPDPEFLFLSRVHKMALIYLNYGIYENTGFILITGEIGTGKTTILRKIIKEIPSDIKLARINNTKVNSEQLISLINGDFGIDTRGNDKTRMLSKLTDFLINQYSQGGRSMIIIDEAQNLSPDLLEEIRLLSNLETDKSKLLQIILVGQPELNEMLRKPELEQLRQRIAINAHISPLNREDTENYINHRLKVAGNEKCVKFEQGVMDVIYEFSKGVPRLINIICDFALLAAFSENRKIIDNVMIKEIRDDIAYEVPQNHKYFKNDEIVLKERDYKSIKRGFKCIYIRLQNLESSVYDVQKKMIKIKELKRLIKLNRSKMNKGEHKLVKKEYELLQKKE